MKINIKDLKEGINKFVLNESPEEIGFENGDIEFNEIISSNIEVNKVGEKFIVKGKIKTAILLECSRCLKKFEYNIDCNFRLIYLKNIKFKEGEISKEEIDEVMLTDDILNIGDDIRQTIILEIPMKPICKESCKGLCANCGKDLNFGKCNCKFEKTSPFSKIRLKI
jgi:uncharacterized protein